MDASLLINLISGAVGGNVAGVLLKKMDLGLLGNALAGIVGGGLGGTIVNSLPSAAAMGGGNMDAVAILTQVASGSVGGGILMLIVGLLRQMLAH